MATCMHNLSQFPHYKHLRVNHSVRHPDDVNERLSHSFPLTELMTFVHFSFTPFPSLSQLESFHVLPHRLSSGPLDQMFTCCLLHHPEPPTGCQGGKLKPYLSDVFTAFSVRSSPSQSRNSIEVPPPPPASIVGVVG